MSATMGTPAWATIIGNALASPSWGTATRTMSAPWVARAWTWISVAPTSSVLVMVIDWMEIGAPSPMSTVPRRIRREGRRSASIMVPLSRRWWVTGGPRSRLEEVQAPTGAQVRGLRRGRDIEARAGVTDLHPQAARLHLDDQADGIACSEVTVAQAVGHEFGHEQ